MNKKIKYYLLISLLLICCCSKTYCINLGDINVKKCLKKVYSEYDSVLVFSSTSYWNLNKCILGIGYKQGKLYTFNLEFYSKKNGDIRIRKHQAQPFLGNGFFSTLNLKKIYFLNADSLNSIYDSVSGLNVRISDGANYSLFVLYPKLNECFLKESYMITYYQAMNPNSDRRYFLNILNQIENLFQRKLIFE